MSVETFRPFFELILADLDPDNKYDRPVLENSELDNSRYNALENVVYIHHQERTSAEVEFSIAHELRHWLQFMTGRLKNVTIRDLWFTTRYRATWHGHRVEYFATNQDQYQLLPWELDANLYACDAMLRLVHLETLTESSVA